VSAIITENTQVSYKARWKITPWAIRLTATPNNSLDASGGSVFLNLIRPAMLD